MTTEQLQTKQKTVIMKMTLVSMMFLGWYSLSVAVVSAQINEATTSKESFRSPLVTTATNSCTGETIQLAGDFHVTVTTTTNKNRRHLTIVSNYQGVNGLGSDGTRYVVPSAGQYVQSTNDEQWSITATYRELLISQGSGDNKTVHGLTHITRDANGMLRVEFTNLVIECQG